MSTVADLSALHLGQGIFHPKMVNQFFVFYDSGDTEIDYQLTRQTIAVSQIIQEKTTILKDSTVTLVIEDEITGQTSKNLQRLYGLPTFNVNIVHMDGNNAVLTTYALGECFVRRIKHAAMTYDGGYDSTPTLSVDGPYFDEHLVAGILAPKTRWQRMFESSNARWVQALMAICKGFRFSCNKHVAGKSRVEHQLVIEYKSLTIT